MKYTVTVKWYVYGNLHFFEKKFDSHKEAKQFMDYMPTATAYCSMTQEFDEETEGVSYGTY